MAGQRERCVLVSMDWKVQIRKNPPEMGDFVIGTAERCISVKNVLKNPVFMLVRDTSWA